MACCGSLTAIQRDCEANLGGIKRVWANCYDPDIKPTITAGVISALGVTTGWVEIEVRRQSSNFTITTNRDDTAGTLSYETALNIVIARMSTQKSRALDEMDKSDLKFIVQDANGVYWYLGNDNYVGVGDGSTATTGTALTDANQYDLTYTDYATTRPYEVSATAMVPIIGAA